MSILSFLRKPQPQGEKSLEKKISEFLSKSLRKEYAPRKTRKAAVCHESIKRVINFESDTCDISKECVMIWRSQEFDTFRFKKTFFKVTGKECGEIADANVLAEDIDRCTHRLPIALCYGCRPEIEKIAELDIRTDIDAFLATGLDCDSPVVITECFTQELEIPAECDLVLEGYIQRSDDTRQCHITCITRKLS